jgi:RNA polymerase sigma factor (sigma-70 family)
LGTHETGLYGGISERDRATELFMRHSSAIYRYCLGRLRSPEEAEDALQATYLNAWRSLKGGFEPHDPRPWLFQIAANVCASTLRSQLGGTRLELRDPEALENLAQVEQPEREAILDLTDAVRDLPDRQRHALVLRDWQGLSYDEIATRMAVSGAAVETLLFRARNKVGATLASREWKPKVATSARALLVWPFGFASAKSAAVNTAAHIKMGLVVACGTVAPLVAFGVLQITVFGSEARKEAIRAPLGAPAMHLEPAASALNDKPLVQEIDARETSGRERTQAGASSDEASRSRNESKDGSGGKPTSVSTPVPQPAPEPAQNEAKITLCHKTPSEKLPGVTLSVAPQAAQNGLSQDAAGACG